MPNGGKSIMAVLAAVMTGPGAGAIATIEVFGTAAETVLRGIFTRKGGKPFELTTGRILLGSIVDNGETVDEVTIGCEGLHAFAIHCHGSPLLVERIMRLLRQQGVQPIPADQMLLHVMTAREPRDAVGTEARLALTTVKTVEGAALIMHQVTTGLTQKARRWRDSLPATPVEQIAVEASQILRDSEPARLMISGCTIALVGPPNTGKSTLLNALAGREEAIVTDVPGTTRDWVSAEIHIPPLAATLIDTAGLDSTLPAADNTIDQAAQRKSAEVLERADLVLLVLDRSRPASPIELDLVNRLSGRRIIVVLNKSDLPPQLDPACLPEQISERVPVSAKQGTGIDALIHAVHQVCRVAAFPSDCLVAFTDRQRRLLGELQRATSGKEAASLVSELLEGPLSV
jgi:tRNA modification GTPase